MMILSYDSLKWHQFSLFNCSLFRTAGQTGSGDRVFQRSCRPHWGAVVLCGGVLSPGRPQCLEAFSSGGSTAHHLNDSSQRGLSENLNIQERLTQLIRLGLWRLQLTTCLEVEHSQFKTCILITFQCVDALHALCWSRSEWCLTVLCAVQFVVWPF